MHRMAAYVEVLASDRCEAISDPYCQATSVCIAVSVCLSAARQRREPRRLPVYDTRAACTVVHCVHGKKVYRVCAPLTSLRERRLMRVPFRCSSVIQTTPCADMVHVSSGAKIWLPVLKSAADI